MANAAVVAWTACIKELQQLVDDPCRGPESAKLAVEKLENNPGSPLPNVAWKRLVHDVQVLL
jgi:hypothetical protein